MNSGVIQIISKNDFKTTYTKLKTALEGNSNIFIAKEIDHKKNAENVDLTLGETKAIFFGNPKSGTPLMQKSITVALDLPQKILIFEQDGKTHVAYNNPFYLKKRHDIQNADDVLEQIGEALYQIAKTATN